MKNFSDKLFISFSAKDRYDIVQPIVYHLKTMGLIFGMIDMKWSWGQ